jgi:hypothetical protein
MASFLYLFVAMSCDYLFYIPAMSATRFLCCRLQNSLPPAVIMYAILPLQDVSFSVNIYRAHISMLYRLVSSLRLAVPVYIEEYLSHSNPCVCVWIEFLWIGRMDQNQQQQGCFVGFSSFLFVSRGIDSLLLSLSLSLSISLLVGWNCLPREQSSGRTVGKQEEGLADYGPPTPNRTS